MRTAWRLAAQLPGGDPALIVLLLPMTKAGLAQLVEPGQYGALPLRPQPAGVVPMPCRKLPRKLDFLP